MNEVAQYVAFIAAVLAVFWVMYRLRLRRFNSEIDWNRDREQQGLEPIPARPTYWEKLDAQAADRAEQQKKIVCPHCQQAGGVTYRQAKRRRRLSATRVVGGIATMGASLPIAGTSKKNVVTEMNCSNCGMTWDVA